MENTPLVPPLLPPVASAKTDLRNRATLKLLFIALLVLLLQLPLHLVGSLQQERREARAVPRRVAAGRSVTEAPRAVVPARPDPARDETVETGYVFEAYRMVDRALKHSVLVLALVFAAFFLFETLAGLRLHAVHYGLVGAAMCLFYLALLALGEVIEPGPAYIGAAAASSLLITLYSAAILRGRGRAAVIAALLASVHSVLYVVLRMENYALLAGTGALFVALAAVMYFTRNVDWQAHDAGPKEVVA
jgi:inner membrane protein involved in colicin E2 resistance